MTLPSFYSFLRKEQSDGSIYYTFSTLKGHTYYAYFHLVSEHSPFAQQLPYFSKYGYLFGFSPSFQTEAIKSRLNDEKIEPTIKKIIADFFDFTGKDKALFYYTDGSDSKQKARSRLFELWYRNDLNKASIYYESLEIEVALTTGTLHEYLSILLFENHPCFEEIKSEFKRLEILLTSEK